MIKKILKWTGIVLACIIGLLLIASAVIYVLGEQIINEKFEPQPTSFKVVSDSAMIAEGERLAKIRGCYKGCHGDQAEGKVWFEHILMGRIVTPDLTRLVSEYTDIQLENAIRQGIKPDGTSLLPMPSSMYHNLTDEDLSAIIAFLRSLPKAEGYEGEVSLNLLPRIFLLNGEFKSGVQSIKELPVKMDAPDPENAFELGKYLVYTSCTECHMDDLKGGNLGDMEVPSLVVMGAAYNAENLTTFFREGKGIGNRNIEGMKEVIEVRFSNFTDREIHAISSFITKLHTMEEYK